MSDCAELIKAEDSLQIPGFSLSEASSALCRAVDYESRAPGDLKKSVEFVRTTRFPKLSLSVRGGFSHFISVENGATYAELWHQNGNWYAVMGPDPSDPTTFKSEDDSGIFEIPRVTKGMPVDVVAQAFLTTIFGPAKLAKAGGCGCNNG